MSHSKIRDTLFFSSLAMYVKRTEDIHFFLSDKECNLS